MRSPFMNFEIRWPAGIPQHSSRFLICAIASSPAWSIYHIGWIRAAKTVMNEGAHPAKPDTNGRHSQNRARTMRFSKIYQWSKRKRVGVTLTCARERRDLALTPINQTRSIEVVISNWNKTKHERGVKKYKNVPRLLNFERKSRNRKFRKKPKT